MTDRILPTPGRYDGTMPTSRARLALLALGVVVCMNGPAFFLQFRVFEHWWDWDGPVVRESLIALAVAATAVVAMTAFGPGRWSRVSKAQRAAIVLVGGLTAWIFATSLWSVAPDITRGRAAMYIGLACFAWLLAQLRFDDLRTVVLLACTVVLVASAAAVAFSDSIGQDKNDDWRGIFTNRNSLAPVAALTVILAVGLAIERRGRVRVGAICLAVLGAVLMLGSGSRTAWLAMFTAAGIGLVVVGTRRARDRWGWPALVVGPMIAVGGAGVVTAVVASLWDESTFIQRRTIWDLVGNQIGERTWQGHGWFTMWTQPDFTSGHELLQRGSAHGSIHDVWLGAGLIGLASFAAVVAVGLANAGLAAWRRPSVATWTWLSAISFLVIENLTESFVLWFSYNWVLLLVAALSVGSARSAEVDRPAPSPSERVTV